MLSFDTEYFVIPFLIRDYKDKNWTLGRTSPGVWWEWHVLYTWEDVIQDFGCERKEGYCLEAVGTGVQNIEWTWKK